MATPPSPIGSRENPRPVVVLPKERALEDGMTYVGWPCRGCGSFVVVDQNWADVARIPNAHYVAAVCPQCKTEHTGPWGGRERFQHVRR